MMTTSTAMSVPKICVRISSHPHEPVTSGLHVDVSNATVATAKLRAMAHFSDNALFYARAVHCGVVQPKTTALSDLHAATAAAPDDEPLYLVPKPCEKHPLRPTADGVNDAADDPVAWLHVIAGPPPGVVESALPMHASFRDCTGLFCRFVDALVSQDHCSENEATVAQDNEPERRAWFPSRSDLRVLRAAAAHFRPEGSNVHKEGGMVCVPFEQCSCAIVAPTDHASAFLHLVALDAWAYRVHVGPDGSTRPRSAAQSSVVLPVGWIPVKFLNRVLRKTAEMLGGKTNDNKGTEALAVGGADGDNDGEKQHQFDQKKIAESPNESQEQFGKSNNPKTPDTVRNALKQAVAFVMGQKATQETTPVGNNVFPDMSAGSGCLNSTPSTHAFSLASAVLKYVLERDGHGDLYVRILAQRALGLSEQSMARLTAQWRGKGERADRQFFVTTVDTVIHSLRWAHALSARLAGVPGLAEEMRMFAARVVVVRALLSEEDVARAEMQTISFRLPPLANAGSRVRDVRIGQLPAAVEGTREKSSLADTRRLIQKNGVRFRCAVDAEWDVLAVWMENQEGRDLEHLLWVCRTVERLVFEIAKRGFHDPDASVRDVETVVEQYREAVNCISNNRRKERVCEVEQLSREIVVCWTAFCAMHCVVEQDVSLVAEFDVPLEPGMLQYLVLSDVHARLAVKSVALYIEQKRKNRAPIFSTLDNDDTVEFARRYAADNPDMLDRWGREKRAAAERRQKRWSIVTEKKNKLTELDAELAGLSKKRGECESRIENMRRKDFRSRKAFNQAVAALRMEERGILSDILDKKGEIRDTEQPPPPLLEPLPSTLDRALAWLFFLWIPYPLEALCKITFVAQQLFFPRHAQWTLHVGPGERHNCSIDSIDAPEVTFLNYYQRRSSHRLFDDCHESAVIFGSSDTIPTGYWYPRTVREHRTSADGIYHPNDISQRLFWNDEEDVAGDDIDEENSNFFDPFLSFDPQQIAHFFTQFSATESLRWALYRHTDNTAVWRSNSGLSSQSAAPSTLDNAQYLRFTALRSYPRQQFRTVCCILRDQTLPLDNPDVATLLSNALHQVGDIAVNDDSASFLWHEDAERCGGWAFLCSVLHTIADQIRCKVRDHACMPVLAEVASFAAQHHEGCADVARDLAFISRCWADDLQAAEDEAQTGQIAEIRARRCLFYLYAVTCFDFDVDATDAARLCELILLFNFFNLFDDDGSIRAAVLELRAKAIGVMCRCQSAILSAIDNCPSILTSALRRVIASAPKILTWKPVYCGAGPEKQRLTSFTATRTNKHVYYVDTFTGMVLYDGMPLSRLPSSVTNDRIFKRVFGRRNFEVTRSSTGSFVTARTADGCFYSFTHGDDKTLRIVEMPAADSTEYECLELLNTGTRESPAKHATEIPMRLQALYSQWYCRAQNVIVFRPFSFNDRKVYFLLMVETMEDAPWKIFKVPPHLTSLPWTEIVEQRESFGSIVVTDDAAMKVALKVISKFESTNGCIELFRRPNKTYAVQLPRFGMEFDTSEDGSLQSTTYKGFKLSEKQNVTDTLRDFSSYMVLSDSEKQNKEKLLIPAGTVEQNGSGVRIREEQSFSMARNVHVYDVHERFGTFDVRGGSKAIEGRLQLAAIFAATDCMLPDARFGRTASESAIHLLRQCWSSVPYSDAEIGHIRTVVRYGWRCPTLALLCKELNTSANSLGLSRLKPSRLVLADGASTRYMGEKRTGELSPRMWLTEDEECVLFGAPVAGYKDSTVVHQCRDLVADMQPSEIEGEAIESLRGLLSWSKPSGSSVGNQPPSESSCETSLEKGICAELRKSWDTHTALNVPELSMNLEVMEEVFKDLQSRCKHELNSTLAHVKSSLTRVPMSETSAHTFCVERAVNIQSTLHETDVARFAREPGLIREFNPFLSTGVRQNLRTHILTWLSLCVLDSKLDRLLRHTRTENTREMIIELREIGREWSVEEKPEWLLFEVEQGLQIRKLQYSIAKFCMEHSHCSTQMNMGEGKTRVILPMLVLHAANKRQLVRLNFLSPLLNEAYDYLHRALTASLLPQRIALLPFSRDVTPTSYSIVTLHRFLERMRTCRGVLCVAPEHILSFHLKWHELRLVDESKSESVRNVMKTIRGMRYFDIMDEVDELLHHKYQLIYAVGDCVLLPSGRERWVACQMVLEQIRSNENVVLLLEKLAKYKQADGASQMPRNYRELRVQPGNDMDENREALLRAIARGVIESPPHFARRLQDIPDEDAAVSFVVDRTRSIEWLVEELDDYLLSKLQKDLLLALRGLLAYGLLELGISQRYRVDFGVDARRGVKNRVAVPYRASDTPTDRAEYAQPDTLILLTHLTYYCRGLSRAEMREALVELIRLGPFAQDSEYAVWFDSVSEAMSDEYLSPIDEASKLDVQNEAQLEILHRVFGSNMHAINFWLDRCVLPRETMQFGQRLSANAFNLADNQNGNIVGFSGTKDRKELLPIQVEQMVPDVNELQATDGKMLQSVFKNATVLELDGTDLLNATVIRVAITQGVNALIDAGATMAGLSNAQVAEKLIRLLNERDNCPFQGVVFFCQNDMTWKVLGVDGMQRSKGNSPVQEQDAIVYFDESRCRGADMKLPEDATGLLTIGPNMAKDKMMQAAGRLRKLDRGQRLIFAVPPELVGEIPSGDSGKINCKSLLQWVIRNTARSIADGLPEWAAQGVHFAATREPRARVIDEKVELEDLYGPAISERSITDHVKDIEKAHAVRLDDLGLSMNNDGLQMCTKIRTRAQKIAGDWPALAISLGEECEREIETERELQREMHREVPDRVPCPDTGLGRVRLGQPRTMRDLRRKLPDVMHMSDAMCKYFYSTGLDDIRWGGTSLYVTKNFIETVRTTDDDGDSPRAALDLGDYMRPVGLVLVFPAEGSVLLLSEHEADDALREGCAISNSSARKLWWVLVSATSLFRDEVAHVDDVSTWPMRVPQSGRFEHGRCTLSLSEATMAGLQLFCGETMFRSEDRLSAVRHLLSTLEGKQAALRLVQLRGRTHMVSRSELEEVCFDSSDLH